MNYKSPLCSCIICHETKSAKGFFSHYIVAHTDVGKQRHLINSRSGSIIGSQIFKKNNERKTEKARIVYDLNPNKCNHCENILSFEKRSNKFCSQSCAATYNNLNSDENRRFGPAKEVFTMRDKYLRQKRNKWRLDIVGAYSKLYYNNCAECGLLSISKSQRKFCNDHSDKYSHKSRAKYWFSFALHDYPDLFDFELIKQHGMRTNASIGGVVRDHKVSVADAIKHNYDPYYIKHPLNCELMLNSENAKKHKKSSITYAELVAMVDRYDSIKNW